MIKSAMRIGYNENIAREWFECVSIQDPIGKFISLYTLLLHHFNDSQKQVDEEILKISALQQGSEINIALVGNPNCTRLKTL